MDTLEYWNDCLAEFKEALIEEFNNPEPNDIQIRLLKEEIDNCNQEILKYD